MIAPTRRRRQRPRASRAQAAGILLLLVALALAGCGGSGGDEQPTAGAPAGFTTYQASWFSISYPVGWTVSEKPNSTGGSPVISILGPNGSGGFPPQIAIGHNANYSSDFDDAMEVFRLASIGQTGAVVSDQPTQLAGAERAQRTEYTQPQQGTDGQQRTIRHVELHALTPGRTMFDVLVRAPQEDFDGAQLLQALDTFRVK
jgi:hypothetical protein